jgi:hypothetical protein
MAAGDRKKVRLYFGDEPTRVEVGEAEVVELEDGRFEITMSLGSEEVADALGVGMEFKGTIPPLPWRDV